MNMKPLFGILMMGLALPVLATQVSERSAGGYIQLRDELPEKDTITCNLPVGPAGSGQTRIYELPADESPCRSFMNKTNEIYFSELPSAAQITLTGNSLCNTTDPDMEDNFWIKLKTTLKFTSPESMSMQYFFSQTKGTIIKPGLLLVDYYLKGEAADAVDQLSCVKVVTSRATLPKPIEWPGLENLIWTGLKPDGSYTFNCPANRIMTGSGFEMWEDYSVLYQCATPMLNGTEVVVKNYRQSAHNSGPNNYYLCPINTIMTGMATNDGYRYSCAEAWLGDTRLEVTPDNTFGEMLPSIGHRFACPSGKALISRYFSDGDKVGYRCGKLFLPAPP